MNNLLRNMNKLCNVKQKKKKKEEEKYLPSFQPNI